MHKIPRVVTIVAFTCSLIHRNKARFFTKVQMLNAGLLRPGDLIESSNFLESFRHWQLIIAGLPGRAGQCFPMRGASEWQCLLVRTTMQLIRKRPRSLLARA
jgi:uncharacterized protein (DUF779 family)